MSSNQLPKTSGSDTNLNETFDRLLLESFMNRIHVYPPNTNTGSNLADIISNVLTPSLPLISSSPIGPNEISSASNGLDESRLGYVANEEAKVEGEIIRMILSGNTDSLRPNSGEPVTVGGHNISVRFRDERESEHRVWEWHVHVVTHDEDNSYSLEYIYGTYFERM